ncbi:MAG: DUF3393 domain-containing protein, partial [Pseudomonadales bacterium]|nr:DUF3393 domain-containing protein [Pseudomonadales bacterium]
MLSPVRSKLMPVKSPLQRLTAILLLMLSPFASAEEDPFDAIDRLLEAQFEETDQSLEEQFIAIDQAMEAAYQRLSREVGAVWGEQETVLPTKSQWTDYSADLTLRREFDFENGVIRIEKVVEPETSIQTAVSEIARAAAAAATDSMADLDQKDHAVQYARAELAEAGIEIPPSPGRKPVLENLIELPSAELITETIEARKPPMEKAAASLSAPVLAATETPLPAVGKKKIAIQIPFKQNHREVLANKYYAAIAREAARHDLEPSLLLAVVETESSFNPRARSPVPAYGLMQLVPRSGAMDAYQYLYGEPTLLGPDYLYEPDQNVELGAAYLNILTTRYLRQIT